MLPSTIRLLIAGALLLHGLGHGGALAALAYVGRGRDTGQWRPARSWLIPSLPPRSATILSSIFWVLSMVGFVAAAMSFWGLLIPADAWRALALASACVSGLGMVLFFGTWPLFNALAALAMNLAVLVTQLWTHWPPPDKLGR
jgi:hypothetical protein